MTASTDQPTPDYTATNKWGVLLHVENETKDERRRRLARETQKARFAADPDFKEARKPRRRRTTRRATRTTLWSSRRRPHGCMRSPLSWATP